MTERVRSQASEMRLLQRIEGAILLNKMRSSEIRKYLNIEPLLLRIKRSQVRWFGLVSRMSRKRLLKQAVLAKANGKRPVERFRTRCTKLLHYGSWMESLGTSPKRNDGADGRP